MINELMIRQILANQMAVIAALIEGKHSDIVNDLLVGAFTNSKIFVDAENDQQ